MLFGWAQIYEVVNKMGFDGFVAYLNMHIVAS